MTRWNPWRSALAGAVIGFIEAAGPDPARRALRRPEPVVRHDDWRTRLRRPPAGLWFLSPLRGIGRRFSRN